MITTIHRFTPPTCTLEIKGKKYSLSRWTNENVFKNFKFKLSFDDPRMPSHSQITVTGDRQSLERLKNLVDCYLQETLYSSLLPNLDRGGRAKSHSDRFSLQAKGLTSHELFLGNLNNDSQDNKITLTTVQLFDLVTALEAYATQIKALPELEKVRAKKAVSLWGTVAVVAVAGVGIAAVWLKSAPVQNIASSPQLESSTTVPQFDDVVPPETPAKSKKRTAQPKVDESFSSATRLPPPPAVDTPKPKPNIPDPADYPMSQVARQSGLNRSVEGKNKDRSQQSTESVTTIPAETNLQTETRSPAQIGLNREEETKSEKTANDLLQELDTVTSNRDRNTVAQKKPVKASQLQEIQVYFKDKWQPPADLKQSLEYRLYLNSDGSIKRIVPIGKASELYLDRTNIPVGGEKFISPLNESQSTTIRLLLNPDGGIKTFEE